MLALIKQAQGPKNEDEEEEEEYEEEKKKVKGKEGGEKQNGTISSWVDVAL